MKKYIIALIVISLLSGSVIYAALTLEEQANKYFNRTCNKRWVTGYRAALCYLKKQVENDEQRINSIEARLNILENQGELIFFDDFNDGDADGWIAGASCSSPSWCSVGNWRVEDGQVVQDSGGDGHMFLLNNYLLSDQIVEARIIWHVHGSANGLAVWRQDDDNWVTITFPNPYTGGILVSEKWCDLPLSLCPRDDNVSTTLYPYQFTERIWRTLKVDTNSITGEISVYIDDEYVFTHTVGDNICRNGLSGFVSGNAGGSFDDFSLISK